MNYFTLMNEAIEYIENNLNRNVTVEELSNRYYISKYYFIRIFKALTNQTVKEYISKRRLTEAAKALQNHDRRVLDVAFDYGFESHEVFTRNFRKSFLVTPSEYRKNGTKVDMYEKAEIVERDFKNTNKDLVVDFKIIHQQALSIVGKNTTYNPVVQASIDGLTPFVEGFLADYNKDGRIDRLYNLASSDSEKESYGFFVGFEALDSNSFSELESITLPESDYAVFLYNRELGEIHTTVMKDICKSIMVSEVTLKKMGIDFIVVFEKDYFVTNQYAIYVPVNDLKISIR